MIYIIKSILSLIICGCVFIFSIFVFQSFVDKQDEKFINIIKKDYIEYEGKQISRYEAKQVSEATDSDNIISVDTGSFNEFDKTYLDYYAFLNDEQKKIYEKLYFATRDMVSGWIDLGYLNSRYSDNITIAYKALTNDWPEFFWLSSTYLVSSDYTEKNQNIAIAFEDSGESKKISYLIPKNRKVEMEKTLNSVINDIMAKVNTLPTDFEKGLYINDYLCRNVTYDETGDMIYSIYGALVEGKAVCEGYSRAMQILCKKAGINATLISGIAGGEGHMWNLIKLDEQWYHTDITWNDTDSHVSHNYLYLSDKEISYDHIIGKFIPVDARLAENTEIYNIGNFICPGNEQNYFIKKSYIIREGNEDSAANIIVFAFNDGSVQMKFENESIKRKYDTDLQTNVQKIQKSINNIVGKGRITIKNVGIVNDVITFYW